jgi:hypothetical protein
MTLTNLIGNERKNDENLLERAMNNPTIKSVLEQKRRVNETTYTNYEYIDKAKVLLNNTLKYFYSEENSLINQNSILKNSMAENSLLVINKTLLGDRVNGHNIINVINDTLDFDMEHGLYKNSNGNILTSDNALFAAALLLIANKLYEEPAKRILDNLDKTENYVGVEKYPENIFIKKEIGKESTSSEANLSFALAEIFRNNYFDANELWISIVFETEKLEYKPLVTRDPYSKGIEITPNALLGVVTYLMMKDKPINERINQAKRYADKIEYEFYENKSGLILDKFDHDIKASSNLSLVLLYLTLGGALDKYIRK